MSCFKIFPSTGCYSAGTQPSSTSWRPEVRERELQCKLIAFWDIGKIILEDPEQRQEWLTSTPQSGCSGEEPPSRENCLPDDFQTMGNSLWSRAEGNISLHLACLYQIDSPSLIKRLLQGVLSPPCTNTIINETSAAHVISPLPFLEHTVCLGLSCLGAEMCQICEVPWNLRALEKY